jgi:hypothetical protein
VQTGVDTGMLSPSVAFDVADGARPVPPEQAHMSDTSCHEAIDLFPLAHRLLYSALVNWPTRAVLDDVAEGNERRLGLAHLERHKAQSAI